jgi:hypothetical protein
MDVILGNTDKMTNSGSKIREQKNLSEISIGDIGDQIIIIAPKKLE